MRNFGKILCVGIMTTSYAYAIGTKVISSQFDETSLKVHNTIEIVTPAGKSVLEEKIKKEKEAVNNPLSVILYRPTYVLPYYYTQSPYRAIYETPQGLPPGNQKIMRNEFKAQMSFLVPVFPHMFHNPNWAINAAYTQLMYWQVYARSQYFRETNYEPEVFFEDHFHRNWLLRVGLNHQSNGRGGMLERSWNRAIASLQVAGENWLVGIRTWSILSQGEDTPKIGHYLGYENVFFSYKIYNLIASLKLQNIESGLHRGSYEVTLSYPLLKHISLFGQYFNGYGQSLVEYDHRTQAAGIGIAFNDII